MIFSQNPAADRHYKSAYKWRLRVNKWFNRLNDKDLQYHELLNIKNRLINLASKGEDLVKSAVDLGCSKSHIENLYVMLRGIEKRSTAIARQIGGTCYVVKALMDRDLEEARKIKEWREMFGSKGED